MEDDDEVKSLLNGLGMGGTDISAGGAGEALLPKSKRDGKFLDNYHHTDGTPIKCGACLKEKKGQDVLEPSKTLAWNTHGYPDDPTRHSTLDSYCDFIWHKQYWSMSLTKFQDHAQTDKGKQELVHWTNELLKIRKERGVNSRISEKEWGRLPLPQVLTREHVAVSSVEDPDELFYTAQQYASAHDGRTPEQDGLVCERYEHKGQMLWGLWLKQDGPLRRKSAMQKKTRLSETVDDGKDVLAADQLAKRFQAEADTIMKPLASDVSPAKPKPQATAIASPSANSGLGAPPSAAASAAGSSISSIAMDVDAPIARSGLSQSTNLPAPQPQTNTKAATKRAISSGTKAKAPKVAKVPTGIPDKQRIAILHDCDSVEKEWAVLQKDEGLQRVELAILRVSKLIEKKKETMAAMPNLDETHMDLHIQLDDYRAKFATWSQVIIAYNAYHGLSVEKRGKAAAAATARSTSFNPALDLKTALKEVESMGEPLPHVFLWSQHLLTLDALRHDVISGVDLAKDESVTTDWLAKACSEVPGSAQSIEALQKSQCELHMTELLRLIVGTATKSREHKYRAKKKFMCFVTTAQQSGLAAELKEQLDVCGKIVEHSQVPTADLRKHLGKVTGALSSGLYKIFAALGKVLIQEARPALAASSHDEALQPVVVELRDRCVIIQPIEAVSGADDIHTHVVVACDSLRQVAQKSSRIFKENHKSTFILLVRLIIKKTIEAEEHCQDTLKL